MNTDHQELSDLIQVCLNGQATDEQAELLNSRLRADVAARDLYLQMADAHSCLAVDESLWMADLGGAKVLQFASRPGRDRWLNWRPLAAAAAGLVIGMLCTSVVFAYVVPSAGKAITLLESSFENMEAPQPSGVPAKFGEWSGDFAEVVSAQKGVTPHGGDKMWRFLRANNALGGDAKVSYVGEAIRAIDLRPLRSAGLKAGSQIEISAWFATGTTDPQSRYHWIIKAAAFEGDVANAPALWQKWNQASTSLAQRELVAKKDGHWQQLTVTMVLPPNADFLVFECAVSQRTPVLHAGVAEFPAHYVDDVRVSLLRPHHDRQTLD